MSESFAFLSWRCPSNPIPSRVLLLMAAFCATAFPARAIFPPDKTIVQEWRFEESAGTVLEGAGNSVIGGSSFHASPAASAATGEGTFRIQRPAQTTLFGSAALAMPPTGKMWIVADIAEWNLESDFPDFRVGFGNVAGNANSTSSSASGTDSYIVAEFSVRRAGLAAFAAGSGGHIGRQNPDGAFGVSQTAPVRLVLEYDRSNHAYEVFFSFDNVTYTSIGSRSTDPSLAPNFVRFMALNSFAQAGTYFDVDRVYVAYGPPAGNISLVGHADPFTQQYGDVGGEGNIAVTGTFLNNVSNGVGIFDISDPANPVLAADYNPGGTRFQDVWVRDGIGYFGCWRVTGGAGNNGVHIVDLSNPYNPVKIAEVNSNHGGHAQVHTLFLDGDFLYTAAHRNTDEGQTVKVFNIANPASPQFVRSIQTTDTIQIHQIAVRDGRLFTSGWGGRTDIFDVTNVANSAPLLGTIESGSNSHSSWPTEDGNVLVSAREISGGDVRFFDISDPANPELILILDHEMVGIGDYVPHNPVIVGDLLFLSWYENGLQVFNIADPARPVRVGYFETGGYGATWDGNWGVYPLLGLDRVLLSDMSNGLFIVDATAVLTATHNYPPLIVKMPESVEKVEGSDVIFAVDATGSGPLHYQWRRNGVPISGENGPELTLADIALEDGGAYSVVVSNDAGEVISRDGTLSVIAEGDATPPHINSQPAGTTATPGQTVTFSVTASGTPQLRYQWYLNDEPIPGAESSSLAVGPVMVADTGGYRARVENGAGEAWSDAAVLEIDDSGFIYAVRISAGPTGAVVSWKTLEPAMGYVEYGEGHHHHEPTTNDSGIQPMHAEFDRSTPATPVEAVSHSAYIGGLIPESDYSYSVVAYRNGVRHESPEFLFTTAGDDKGGEAGEVPQWWMEHFFDEAIAGDTDADGDGWNVWEEYLAGTSPVDSGSRPRVSVERGTGGEISVIYWPVHPGRAYRLEGTSVLGGAWTSVVAAETTSDDGTRTFTVSDPPPGGAFFRVRVEIAGE